MLLNLMAKSSGGGGPVTPYTLASPHNFLVDTVEAAAVGFTTRRFRMPIYIAGARRNLKFAFSGNYILGAIGNDYTVTALALERNSPASFAPITFSGGRSVAVTNGAVEVLSDDLLPSAFGLSEFPANELFWLRGEYTVAAAGLNFPQGRSYISNTGLTSPACIGVRMQASSVVSPVDATGTMTFTNVADYRNPYLPIVIGQLVTPNSVPSIFGIGDSIMQGQSGSVASGMTSAFQKAIMNTDITTGAFGGLWMGQPGTTYTAVNGRTWTTYYAKYATKVVDEYGTNYFATGSTADPVTAKTAAQTFWAQIAAAGCTKIIRAKLIPRTLTTDGTVVLNTAWGTGGSARQFNDWLDTPSLGVAQGVTLQIENCNSIRAGTNQTTDAFYQWAGATSGVLGPNTGDGTHPNTAGYDLYRADIRTAYLA